jgi:O-antigen biosynthesis protein
MIDFSVLIPVYNTRPDHLLEAFYSILNQTVTRPYKIVIIDDGSTDKGTLFMLQFLRTFPNVNVHTLPENGGTSVALNKGHELIESTYIALMGSDDISHPDRFRLQCDFLDKSEADVLGANCSSFYSNDIRRKLIWTSQHFPRPVRKMPHVVNHGTLFYKNQAVKEVGGYKPELRRAQDIDIINRMIGAGKTIRNISDNLYMWRRYKK